MKKLIFCIVLIDKFLRDCFVALIVNCPYESYIVELLAMTISMYKGLVKSVIARDHPKIWAQCENDR